MQARGSLSDSGFAEKQFRWRVRALRLVAAARRHAGFSHGFRSVPNVTADAVTSPSRFATIIDTGKMRV